MLTLEDTDPWKGLEVLLGNAIEVHKSRRGFVHVHLSQEDIARLKLVQSLGERLHRRLTPYFKGLS